MPGERVTMLMLGAAALANPAIAQERADAGDGIADLSRRELQVLEMVATGANNAEIAERFVISLNTVKSHVSRILRKLKATNRTEAASVYIEQYGTPGSTDKPSLHETLQ